PRRCTAANAQSLPARDSDPAVRPAPACDWSRRGSPVSASAAASPAPEPPPSPSEILCGPSSLSVLRPQSQVTRNLQWLPPSGGRSVAVAPLPPKGGSHTLN